MNDVLIYLQNISPHTCKWYIVVDEKNTKILSSYDTIFFYKVRENTYDVHKHI